MNLATLRVKAGWSQEFVARQIGVSRQTVINWENGTVMPTAKFLLRLAKLFGVTVDELLKGVE